MTTQERLEMFLGKDPSIPGSAYVAEEATLLGDVRLGEQSSIWPGCVVRGDINYIEIGSRSNVQDGTVVHLADDYPVIVGKDVTIGHKALIHACAIEDECLIGMGATVMDGAVVGAQSIVGAGSLVTQGAKIPPGSLVMGAPARIKRELSAEEREKIKDWAAKYLEVSAAHKRKYKGKSQLQS